MMGGWGVDGVAGFLISFRKRDVFVVRAWEYLECWGWSKAGPSPASVCGANSALDKLPAHETPPSVSSFVPTL